jgi:hypothetical protein
MAYTNKLLLCLIQRTHARIGLGPDCDVWGAYNDVLPIFEALAREGKPAAMRAAGLIPVTSPSDPPLEAQIARP